MFQIILSILLSSFLFGIAIYNRRMIRCIVYLFGMFRVRARIAGFLENRLFHIPRVVYYLFCLHQ